MRRAKWTFMQWNPAECRFLPRNQGELLSVLSTRQRLTTIDKLLEKPVDPRPLIFNSLLEKQKFITARSQLDKWANELKVDTLEEYCVLLAASSNNINTVGPQARRILQDFSLWARVESSIREAPFSISKRGEVGLLDALENSTEAPEELQNLINKHTFLDPELQRFAKKWQPELLSYAQTASKESEISRELALLIDNGVDLAAQAELVAQFLAHFTASSVHVTFPQSLGWVCRQLGNAMESSLLARVASRLKMPYYNAKSEFLWNMLGQQPWVSKHKLILGAFWVHGALQKCRFDVLYNGRFLSRPAFWNTWHASGPTKRGILLVNGTLISQLKRSDLATRTVTDNQLPLLVPPRPWSSTRSAELSLYERGLRLVTSQSTEGKATVDAAIESGAALPQLAGLNRLQSQAWRINRPVLTVLNHLFQAGKVLPNFEHNNCRSDEVPIGTAALQKKAERSRKVTETQWRQALAIADSLGHRKFYFPMYMDFRGRCYPMAHSLLSFMGTESFRALFLFGDSVPLGPQGLGWLKVHLANLYGQCKLASYEGRMQWVDTHRAEIVDSAGDPLKNNWWQQGAKPFQVLAACIDLTRAWNSQDPSAYCSSIPVQLDGTSNGLQHLVALARDEKTAQAVNLKGSELNDVYMIMARELSALDKAPNDTKDFTRSLMKKVVMIFFYGGSEMRMAETLESLGPQQARQVTKQATKLMEKMFSAEGRVQGWLNNCARRLMDATRADHQASTTKESEENDSSTTSKSHGAPALTWTSPLGFPVVQPYAAKKLMAIRTPLQSFFWPSPFHIPSSDKSKQLAGVAANFVHTLDAAHMLATAQNMPSHTSFASIHDSFWTHAGTVDTMNRILREQFVSLHSNDVLETVWQEWTARYEGYMCLATVYPGKTYDELISMRGSTKESEALDEELKQLFCGTNPALSLLKPKVEWTEKGPQVGTPAKKSIKMWVPLEFPPPTPRGKFDIADVKSARYFFS